MSGANHDLTMRYPLLLWLVLGGLGGPLADYGRAADSEVGGLPPLEEWWNGSSILPETALPQSLEDKGVIFQGDFVSSFFGNPLGGREQSFAYVHILYFQLNLDLEKVAGWEGGTLVWSWADVTGNNLSQSIGNVFTIVGDYGPTTFYFNLLYLQQEVELFQGILIFKVGQLSALNDFLTADVFDYYSNAALQADILPGINIVTTFQPTASWGAFLKYAEPAWYLQTGLYQLSDRIGLNYTHGLDYSMEESDGVMALLEAAWTPRHGISGNDRYGYPGHYRLGSYFSSWTYPELARDGVETSAFGFYALADQLVWRESGRGDQGLTLWGAFLFAPQLEIDLMPYFVSGGLQYLGLFPFRPEDETVCGVAYGAFSANLAAEQKRMGELGQYYEMILETSHWFNLSEWVSVSPNLQYVINPGGAHNITNAWVLGAVVSVAF